LQEEIVARQIADAAEVTARQATDTALQNQITALQNPIEGYVIGGIGPGGGIIFHLTADGKKGLEAAPLDQAAAEQWFFANDTGIATNAAKSGINGGSFNTERIIGTYGWGKYAAVIAANYDGGGYGDWYLPSIKELELMYQNLHLQGLGGFAGSRYWSSTEHDATYDLSLYLDFSSGEKFFTNKYDALRVRAVRAF